MKTLHFSLFKTFAVGAMVFFLTLSTFAQKDNDGIVKQNYDLSAFNKIEVGGAFEVYIRQGDEADLTIIADEKTLDKTKVKVSDGTLLLKTEGYMTNPKELKAYITVKDLVGLDISGACEVEGKNTIVALNLNIETSGAANISMALRCRELEINSSGASEITLTGDVEYLEANTSGASTLRAEKLLAETAFVESSGASTIKVDVTKSLDARASGASSILYNSKGEVNLNSSGASDIKKM